MKAEEFSKGHQSMNDTRVVQFSRPMLGPEEAQAAYDAVMSGWVTQGPRVAEFEREFAGATTATHACAVSNCTTALHLALRAVGVGEGDEVITVSYTFLATANAIRYLGAWPVFVDIERGTRNMDPALVEAAITSRTKAILCVHQFGMPCDLAAILAVANRHGLPVIEDAACAAGSEIQIDGQWEPIGKPQGVAACFSFHPRKVLTAGDGGIITSNDAEFDAKVRRWRQHAMSVSDLTRNNSSQVIIETFDEVGYNYRMTDIQAAVARRQLVRLPAIIKARREWAARYVELLSDLPGLEFPVEPSWARSNWQTYNVLLQPGIDRDAVMQSMLEAGVQTRRPTFCCHLEKAHNQRPLRFPLPVSEDVYRRNLGLPLFPHMSVGDQDQVIAALRNSLR
ncbi:Predicted pyridoxal phosphate-dependent enzyme [Paramagnetospirillum magneticum AMB-1]|uniref:Predicted pyridoxal phosphate-dependent enzyme n=2 Tax=Paramagnetospirillum magneticum TaxID=84159 RepID=Q2WB60_PARM1|nr:Predicted pyridoxal phosphate-dependent enzyme [Paramagnetospirillum magneticum AMB-1]